MKTAFETLSTRELRQLHKASLWAAYALAMITILWMAGDWAGIPYALICGCGTAVMGYVHAQAEAEIQERTEEEGEW